MSAENQADLAFGKGTGCEERFVSGRAFRHAERSRAACSALQFAEKLAIRIRVSLQRYRKCRRIRVGFSRCGMLLL